jgi:hypothetical protein
MDALHKALPKGNIFQMMHVLNGVSTFFNIKAGLIKTYRPPHTILPSSMNAEVLLCSRVPTAGQSAAFHICGSSRLKSNCVSFEVG